jgi:hypothetical protein
LTISEATPPPAGGLGRAYEIGPPGTVFGKQVQLSFRYATLNLGATSPNRLTVATLANGAWQPVPSTVDELTKTVAGETTHFSVWGLVAAAEPPSDAGTDAADANDSGGGTGGSVASADGGPDTPVAGAGGAAGAAGAGGGAAGTGGTGVTTTRLFAIVSTAANTLSLEVVDAATWTQIRSVPLTEGGASLPALPGSGFAGRLSVAPSGQRVYWDTKAIDAVTGVTTSQTFGAATALSPDGTTLYIVENGTDLTNTSMISPLVWVGAIDTTTLQLKDHVTFDDVDSDGLALSPDGKTLVVSSNSRASSNPPVVRFLHTENGLGIDATVPVTLDASVNYEQGEATSRLRSPLFVPDGRVLFWNDGGEVIYVFDSASKSQLAPIEAQPRPNFGGLGGGEATCFPSCMAYDPIAAQVFVPRRNLTLSIVSLPAGTTALQAVAVNKSAPPLAERPAGGSPYMPVLVAGASATLANVTTGSIVYTFSGTGVSAMAFANVP